MNQLTITIKEKQKQYPIIIGQNLLEKIASLIDLHQYSRIVVIADNIVGRLYAMKLQSSLPQNHIVIGTKPGEKEKNLENVQYFWQELAAFGCDRKSLVINLGGGVIGDMGGFAASTYMRGIDFIQVPTTLLASVDASIGGKTGIDFAEVKNLIGTFQQPVAVIIDVSILQTLPKREFLNGFAEIIKHGLIKDKAYFDLVTSKKPIAFSQEELINIITRSCEIKKAIVESDDTEQGIRKLVNFGHTIGHAIEALSWETKHPLKHGEAIHIGMLAETRISNLVDLLSDEESEIIENKLQATGLPITITDITMDRILEKIKTDKKNTHGKVKWVLLKHIGEAVYDQIVDNKVIREAMIQIIT